MIFPRMRARRGTMRALLGAAVVATALLPVPCAFAEGGTGSAAASPPPPQADPASPALGFRGPDTAIVVLGYGLLPDGGMRPELLARLHAGFAQALLAPASPVIVTGGNPRNGVTEAQAMARWLIAHGIPAERIVVEPDAASTAQNAAHSARIMRDIGARDAVVVTSADHIDRALRDFLGAGVDVVATVTPDQVPMPASPFGTPA
ncbi:YdcF family protein [Nocardia xishanensis]|uniref:YdcF family protein n=1 Tax=Nocardia xishanensis TaxID=238964 RepID=UPI001FDFBF92|nr:YdcF family protein [Nocardia xishanensis]